MIRPLVLTLPVVVAATAAGQTVPAGSPTGVSDALGVVGHERPDAASGPTRVTIGLYVVDISRIDDVALTATVDFHLRLKWTDPRLASEVGGTRVLDADDVWTPVAQVANERRLFETFSEVVRVDSAGQATYRQRFHGTITTPLDLRNFPLDRNTVRFRVVAAGYGPGEVEFVVDDHITGQHRPLSIIDFRVADGRARLGTYELQPGGDRYSEFEYALEVSRAQAYFIWKVIVPLCTIVFMSWAAFWMDPSQQGSRVSVAITSVLTLIAYRFLLGALVPRISYLTRLDIFILGTTILVFLGLVEVVASGNLAARERVAASRRIDRWSRLLFPAAFAIVIAWAFWL
ncbi:MAG: hypothetical protein ACYSWT_09650 [Planctomycetota bacterium]